MDYYTIPEDLNKNIFELARDNDIEGISDYYYLNFDFNSVIDEWGNTPLHWASKYGSFEAAQSLLKYPKHINNIRNFDGDTPLHNACRYGHDDVARILLKSGANIECINNKGNTPLFVACKYGSYHVARLLLDNKAYVNSYTNKKGDTPLHIACRGGHTKIVEILINHGADIDIINRHHDSPLTYACLKDHSEVVQILLLSNLSDNSSFELEGKYGCKPLHIVCRYGHIKTLRILLSYDTIIKNINSTENLGDTPLHYACLFNKKAKIVRLLLSKGANINVGNIRGDTPLHYACQKELYEIVKILLDHRADVDVCIANKRDDIKELIEQTAKSSKDAQE